MHQNQLEEKVMAMLINQNVLQNDAPIKAGQVRWGGGVGGSGNPREFDCDAYPQGILIGHLPSPWALILRLGHSFRVTRYVTEIN